MLSACSGASASDDIGSSVGAAAVSTAGPVITEEFVTPSLGGEQPVIDAINGATSSIRMIMFHLTNPAVVAALVAAAHRGVDVEMILDNGNLASHTPTSITTPLKNAGIKVIPSSTGFRITHVKSLVIDNSKALIMSLNLTMDFATTRDYAVMTTDRGVVAEFLKVFDADVVNAEKGTANTPALTSPHLAWSPVNSEGRLTAFVNAAQHTLVATSENLGDPDIQSAMIAAAKRGVEVRVISPLCDQNVDATFDLPFLAAMNEGGVLARAMPFPPSADVPYMHAKMMIADGTSAFIGSVNFSTASTTDARELGIFFTDATAISMISAAFEQDWTRAIVPPPAASVSCTAPTGDAGPIVTPDAGAPEVDAATPPHEDAGAPTADAGAVSEDGGSVTVDAGAVSDDAGATKDAAPACEGYASPTTAAGCNGCTDQTCQDNGCYGGYWCETGSGKCVSPSKVSCGK
jgi:phosphatidylserine/phosphatidylglycerophosphate/cardiolipin synthase-like enzyme